MSDHSGATRKKKGKWKKSGFTKSDIFSNRRKIFHSKIDFTILKPVTKIHEKLKFVSWELIEKLPVKIFMAGLGRFITGMDYMIRNKHFLFIKLF